MNRDEILRKAVQVHQQEPLELTPRGISRRDRELAEASGRLLEKRLDKIDERLKNLQDQLEDSDKKAPIRSIWTGVVVGVLTAISSYFIMKYVTMPTTSPFTTPSTTANSKAEEISIDYSDY